MSYNSNLSEISGDLKETNFSAILCDLYYKRATGYLSIESSLELKVSFFHGFVEYVHSSDPDLLPGKLLVQNNYISEEEKQEVLDFSKDNDLKIGRALIQMGKLTPHELKHILDLQLKLKLLNGFHLSEGSYKFNFTEYIDVDTLFHVHPVQVIYDAIDGHLYIGNIDLSEEVLGGSLYPTLNFDELEKITFSTSREYKIIDMIKKPVKVKQIISNSPFGSQKTLNFLKFLKFAIFIRIETENNFINFLIHYYLRFENCKI